MLAASFASSTAVLLVLREREENRREAAEEALAQSRKANQVLKGTLESQEAKAGRLELELLSLERMNQLTLVRLKNVEKKLNRLQKEIRKERSENQTLAKERSVLNNKLMIVLSEKKSLATRLNKLLARSSDEVDLGQIVVSATPPVEGKVLVVNPPHQFVVINVGSRRDLDVGTLLNVYRKDQFIGRVQVEQVREAVAACKILPEWTLLSIEENDLVKEL